MRLVLMILCAAAVLCGCSSGPRGQFQLPVLLPVITGVVVPAGTIAAGDTVEFTVNWSHGRSPCELVWVFPEQPDPLVLTHSNAGQSDTVTVTLSTTGTLSGSVQVTDAGGNAVSSSFSYTVVAAP
jgi:hypothetical protein